MPHREANDPRRLACGENGVTVEAAHVVLARRAREWRGAADERDRLDAVAKARPAGERIWAAAGPAHDGKPIEAELVGSLSDVARPIGQPPARSWSRKADAGSVERDEPDPEAPSVITW